MEIYPDIDGLKGETVFQCRRKECMRKTCRVCRFEEHPYLTCEQFHAMQAKNNINDGSAARKHIEESMSSALIRLCTNEACKTPMIKEGGCNKLTCPRCKRLLCYLCGKDVTVEKYAHWDKGKGCGRKLYDVRNEEKEVEKARIQGVKEVGKWGGEKATKIKIRSHVDRPHY